MEKETYNYLIGGVNFANKSDFQAIYASQLYGTFFGIYVKFNKTRKHEDNFYLEDAKVRLLNYKGPINLGITQAEFIKLPDGEQGFPPGGVFKIEVQALYKSKDVPIKNIDPKYPFLEGESYLSVDRRLKKMHPDPTPGDPNKGIPLQNGVFDDEFWYRDKFTRDLEQVFKPWVNHPLEWNSPDPGVHVGYPSEWCISGINAVTWLHE